MKVYYQFTIDLSSLILLLNVFLYLAIFPDTKIPELSTYKGSLFLTTAGISMT